MGHRDLRSVEEYSKVRGRVIGTALARLDPGRGGEKSGKPRSQAMVVIVDASGKLYEPIPRFLFRVCRRLLLLTLIPGLLGAARIPYADDPWIEVETSNFRLISNAEKSVTVSVAERLEHFRALAAILTGATRIDSTLPTRVFVFGDDTWSYFYDDPEFAGYFFPDMEANYIGLDMSRAAGDRGMEIVLHEYVHFLSRNRGSRVHSPTWYEEGFADAISTARIEEGKIYVGIVPGGRAAFLEKKKWLPLERVVTARGYAGLNSRETSMFYAQSGLLVHRLTWGHVVGLKPLHEQVPEYIRRVADGEPEALAFLKTFGVSFKAMQKELREYLRKGPPEILVDQKPPEFGFEPEVRKLPAEESLVLLGELQLARGEKGAAQAEALGRRALDGAPDNARAMLLLAGALIQQGREPEDDLAKRALASAPDDPDIVRGAARLGLWRLQRPELPASERWQVATQTRDLYARAVTLAPDAPAAHAGLGYAQLSLNQPVEADRSLQQAFRMVRWDLNLALALGALHAQYGRPEDAMKLLREVAASAHDEGMRARAQELIDGMEAGTPPSPPRSSHVGGE
jgi:tetratricopeptide (TPR) repeat protein